MNPGRVVSCKYLLLNDIIEEMAVWKEGPVGGAIPRLYGIESCRLAGLEKAIDPKSQDHMGHF
jgi:hypothetical protein